MQIYRILFKHVIKKQKNIAIHHGQRYQKISRFFYNPYLQTMKGHRIYKGDANI